jgi:hypothetical protein
VQWAVFGQNSRKGPHRVDRFRHGDYYAAASRVPKVANTSPVITPQLVAEKSLRGGHFA